MMVSIYCPSFSMKLATSRNQQSGARRLALDPSISEGSKTYRYWETFAIPGGSHLAGNSNSPGFLMNPASPSGGGILLPSATDVLVIAEDQEINNVHLAR